MGASPGVYVHRGKRPKWNCPTAQASAGTFSGPVRCIVCGRALKKSRRGLI